MLMYLNETALTNSSKPKTLIQMYLDPNCTDPLRLTTSINIKQLGSPKQIFGVFILLV